MAEVYNIGGGRYSNVSMMEAIVMSEEIAGKKMNTQYCDDNRVGDHIWWIGNLGKFESHYPEWKITCAVPGILQEVFEASSERE